MRWTLPNSLTVFRLAAAPGVAVVFVLLPRPLADWVALVLFMGAGATDWLDGYLARAWGQVSRIGTMLDPIADKAMVIIALAVLLAASGLTALLALPVAAILFREVFVSGLREYLGDVAGTLQVTNLAKWKTTTQMAAIATLFLAGIFWQGDPAGGVVTWAVWAIGVILLWLAAALTLMSGWDYFQKALPLVTAREGDRA